MITSERCEDIGSWLSENAQKETPEYTSTMAVRLYALTHSFSRRFGPRAPLNVAICRAALRWVAIRRDASRSDALCTGLRLRLRMAIRRYVAIRRDMWRCHALCVPYVSSTSLPEDSGTIRYAHVRGDTYDYSSITTFASKHPPQISSACAPPPQPALLDAGRGDHASWPRRPAVLETSDC